MTVRRPSATDTATTVGERFAHAVAGQDRAALLADAAPDVEFRGLTPRRAWTSDTAQELVDDIVLGTWFAAPKVIETLESVATGTVSGRSSVTYRLLLHTTVSRWSASSTPTTSRRRPDLLLRILCSGILPR